MVTRRGAFSLVEVIVALTLLSVGLLAVAASAAMAATVLRQSELAEEAAFAASQVLDSLAVAAAPVSARQSRGPLELEWTVSQSERTLHIDLSVAVRSQRTTPLRFSLTSVRP